MKINIHHSILPPEYTDNRIHVNTKNNIDRWINLNPNIQINQNVWAYQDCRDFLYNFDIKYNQTTLQCFDKENDGRYKSDIWRLCVLFEYGGIYVDIDQELLQPFNKFLDFQKYDFCCTSNMHRDNLSNGFIYAKKNSNIIFKNIQETIFRYNNNMLIGGCHVMGSVISHYMNNTIMPIGDVIIGNEKCLILHEIGDYTLPNTSREHFNSFGIYTENDTFKIMNSRYSTYFMDKYMKDQFIEIKTVNFHDNYIKNLF